MLKKLLAKHLNSRLGIGSNLGEILTTMLFAGLVQLLRLNVLDLILFVLGMIAKTNHSTSRYVIIPAGFAMRLERCTSRSLGF